MQRHLPALLFCAIPLATALGSAAALQPATQAASRSGLDLAALDRAVEPCTDFYQFACGGWIRNNPLPSDRRSYGRFQEVQDRNFAILRRILEQPAGAGDEKKAGDYYAACMDEATIDRRGVAPLAADLARIDGVKTLADLPPIVAHLHEVAAETPPPGTLTAPSAFVFFRFGATTDLADANQEIAIVAPSGLGLPDRDYYLKTDERSAALRQQYRDHVAKMLGLTGMPADEASTGAEAVLNLESRLASGTLEAAARRDPNARNHPMKVSDLQALAPGFDWESYFAATKAPTFSTLNVAEPQAVRALERVLSATPIADLKAYMKWHLVHASAATLPKAFADANFEFYSRTLLGQQQEQPRWRRCIIETDEHLGEALGKAFVEEAFGARAKQDTLAMVRGIKAALARDIDSLTWMSDQTKRAAKEKLAAVEDRIGYPDKWRDYSALRIARDDAFGNLERARAFKNDRARARIGQPVDRTEWSMTPPTVNAYYSSDRNNINFPAGILQPPFYEAGRDAAVNYGGAGAVIGHELTHGFDDQGRKYDANGNLRDWWTPDDAKAFEERATCIADEYSQFTVAGDAHINGRLTLGENTADNGGVRLALMAYLAGPGATPQPVLDGFTPEQRVFLGYAQVWCENGRDEFERLKAATNPHSSNKYRVNGVVSNMPEFRKAFSCKADAPMVRTDQCRVW